MPERIPNPAIDRTAALAAAALTFSAVSLSAIYIYMSRRWNLLSPVWIYVFLYACAFGWYLYSSVRLAPALASAARWTVPFIICFGVLFRLVLVPAPPSLSTDIYRYIWDGRLTCHGINPYRWAPYDDRLAAFRDDQIWTKMEYKAYQTVYMPASQLIFALDYVAFGDSLSGYKLSFVLFDVGSMLLMVPLLKRFGHPPTRVIWYAWNPLPIVEVGLAGHQDSVGVFLLLLALLLMFQGRKAALAVTLAAAGLTKGFALLLAPLFARRFGVAFAISGFLALVYLGMPAWVYLPAFLHGMTQYLNTVHVNSGLFYGVDRLLSLITRYHYFISNKLSGLAILGALLWSVRSNPASDREVLRRSLVVITTCLLVVPTLFPWYLLWVLPLAVLYRGARPSAAFITLSGTTVLLYTYYIAHMPYWWAPVIEYVPFYGLLIWEIRQGYWSPPGPDLAAGSGASGGDTGA